MKITSVLLVFLMTLTPIARAQEPRIAFDKFATFSPQGSLLSDSELGKIKLSVFFGGKLEGKHNYRVQIEEPSDSGPRVVPAVGHEFFSGIGMSIILCAPTSKPNNNGACLLTNDELLIIHWNYGEYSLNYYRNGIQTQLGAAAVAPL